MDEYAVEPRKQMENREGALKRWIIEHEDRASFLFLYVAAAVVLSIVISLFWLAIVVFLHLLFEVMRFATHEDRKGRLLGEALWEVKLDLSLILIALALAVYIDAVFGVLGLSTAARAAGASARFVALQRALRGILISLDDVLLVTRGILKRYGGRSEKLAAASTRPDEVPRSVGASASAMDADERPGGPVHGPVSGGGHGHGSGGPADLPSWRGRWKTLDWTTLVITVTSVALLIASPWLTHHTHHSALSELLAELHPWPSDSPLQGWIDRSVAWIRG